MSETLFPGYDPPGPPPVEPPLRPDQRRTLRQATQVAQGIHPLTGQRVHLLAGLDPKRTDAKNLPYRCGSCYFRVLLSTGSRTVAKCAFGDGIRMTHSVASDVRAWWPACRDYSPGDTLSDDAARGIPEACS